MDARVELKDAEHPQAKEAAEATARLLVVVRERREAIDESENGGGEEACDE